jgi:hypothetical protein
MCAIMGGKTKYLTKKKKSRNRKSKRKRKV